MITITAAIVCGGYEMTTGGGVNLYEVGDSFLMPKFPDRRTVALAVFFDATQEDVRSTKTLSLTIADDEGKILGEARSEATVGAPHAPGLPASCLCVFQTVAEFPHEGNYTFDVFVEGRHAKSTLMRVFRHAPSADSDPGHPD